MSPQNRSARAEPTRHGRGPARHDLHVEDADATPDTDPKQRRAAWYALGGVALIAAAWVLWAGVADIIEGNIRGGLSTLAFLPLLIAGMTTAYESFTDREEPRGLIHLALLMPVCCLLSFLSHIV